MNNKTKLIILYTAVAIAIVLLALIIYSKFVSKTDTTTGTHQPSVSTMPSQNPLAISPSATVISQITPAAAVSVSPLEKTVPGRTTDNEVKSLPNLIKSTPLSDGQTQYEFKSSLLSKNNIITTKNNSVTIEKIMTPIHANEPGYATISGLTQQFGSPELTVKGSITYGWNISTYIYASKGFAFIGNSDTDEVYEIDKFIPTDVASFKSNFGQDLNPNAKPPLEGAP